MVDKWGESSRRGKQDHGRVRYGYTTIAYFPHLPFFASQGISLRSGMQFTGSLSYGVQVIMTLSAMIYQPSPPSTHTTLNTYSTERGQEYAGLDSQTGAYDDHSHGGRYSHAFGVAVRISCSLLCMPALHSFIKFLNSHQVDYQSPSCHPYASSWPGLTAAVHASGNSSLP